MASCAGLIGPSLTRTESGLCKVRGNIHLGPFLLSNMIDDTGI